MKEIKVPAKIYETDRNWLEMMKRRLKMKSYADVIKSLRKIVAKHKLHEELK